MHAGGGRNYVITYRLSKVAGLLTTNLFPFRAIQHTGGGAFLIERHM